MTGRIIPALIVIILLAIVVKADPEFQLIKIPGYPGQFQNRAYAGYLDTSSQQRKLHYIFIQSNKGINNSHPVLLWLNGGPGCTSKIGFVQQISPYCLNESSKVLQFNPYGWTNLTNLLFIDSPAGVGFSINKEPNYIYNDVNTAKDNLHALKHFFKIKFPQYANNTFYIAGQSYAGKYIPDLAVRILSDNTKQSTPIKLSGLLIGNGILSWQDIQNNRVEWMMSHNFIDPKLIPYWERSCKTDANSAGCQYFYQRYEDLVYRIDAYNIYGECYGRKGPPQQSMMAQLSLKFSNFYNQSKRYGPASQYSNNLKGDWCSYDNGIEGYLNTYKEKLNSIKSQNITVCNMDIFKKYTVDEKGSMLEMASLLQKGMKIYLYNGDWDDVIPFTDTNKNLNRLGVKIQGSPTPWFINQQHAGFIKKYSFKLTYYQVKGAGHEAPLYQRERTFKMLQKFIYET